MKRRTSKVFWRSPTAFIIRSSMLLIFLGVLGVQSAYAGLTVTPTSWNVVGLDSNNTNSGPDTYQIGGRVCNTGGTAVTNIVGNFIWDSSNAYINLNGASALNVSSLAGGACIDLYYSVVVTRTSLAYNATRRYHITVSATGVSAISTPT
ncbi:MAG: hypothetical protein QOF72_731, partial [Blastocatellia bacterium]|nr:hypothetical protein [Blastocatellia bacterium]